MLQFVGDKPEVCYYHAMEGCTQHALRLDSFWDCAVMVCEKDDAS
jgi:hypothetical protein